VTDRSDRVRHRIRGAQRRLRRILRVARWETVRASGGVDRRTLLAALALLLLVAGGVLGGGLAAGVVGLDVDRDVYRVAVDGDSPYADAVEAEPSLTAVPLGGAPRSATRPTLSCLTAGRGSIDRDRCRSRQRHAEGRGRGRRVPGGSQGAQRATDGGRGESDRRVPDHRHAPVHRPDQRARRRLDARRGRLRVTAARTRQWRRFGRRERRYRRRAHRRRHRERGQRGDDGDNGGFAVPSVGGAAFGADTVGSPGSIRRPSRSSRSSSRSSFSCR